MSPGLKFCCLPEELKKQKSTLCHAMVKVSYFFAYATAALVSTLKISDQEKVKTGSFIKARVSLPSCLRNLTES
jgi:hypothetical protein